MAVDSLALTTRAKVLQYMGTSGPSAAAMLVYCDASDATAATVQVTDTAVVLVITGGGSAGTTTLTLSDAANDTLGELVTVIAATSGWAAELLGASSASSTNLIAKPATSALGQSNTLTLFYRDVDLIDELINRASDLIETVCSRRFVSATYFEWRTLDGGAVMVENWPVTAVKRLAYGSADALTITGTTTTDIEATVEVQDDALILRRFASDGTETATSLSFATYPTTSDLETAIDATTGWSATLVKNVRSRVLHRLAATDAAVTMHVTYPDVYDLIGRVEEANGLIHITRSGGNWTASAGVPGPYGNHACRGHASLPQRVLVEYTAGYATVPDDVEQVCIEMVKAAYDARKHDESMQSESIGDYSYTLLSGAQRSLDLDSRLAFWRDIR